MHWVRTRPPARSTVPSTWKSVHPAPACPGTWTVPSSALFKRDSLCLATGFLWGRGRGRDAGVHGDRVLWDSGSTSARRRGWPEVTCEVLCGSGILWVQRPGPSSSMPSVMFVTLCELLLRGRGRAALRFSMRPGAFSQGARRLPGGHREPDLHGAMWLVLVLGCSAGCQSRQEMVSGGNGSWQEPQHLSKWVLIGTG